MATPSSSDRTPPAPLVQLRTLTLAFAGALVGIGVVNLLLHSGAEASGSVGAICIGVALISVAGVVLSGFVQRTLPCGDPATMLNAFRARQLLRVALCESGALVGFALGVVASSPWPYFIAGPIAIVGILRTAPTPRALQAEDERLALSGCATSLHATIVGTPGNPSFDG